jgi:diguanylate cyclase (GGDEF)-like protein
MIQLDQKQTSGVKIFAFFIAMALLLLALNVGVKSTFFSEFTEKTAMANAPLKIRERQNFLNEYLELLPRQIEALTSSESFQTYRKKPKTQSGPLRDVLQVVMKSEPDIMQIRYLNAEGVEQLNLKRPQFAEPFHWVPEAKLQDKSNRGYFQLAKYQTEAKTLLSDIELNQEFGEVEHPFKPVIRVMRPVFDQQRFAGVWVINYFVAPLLDDLVRAPFYDMVLFDGQGNVLKHSDARYDWSAYRESGFGAQEPFQMPGEKVIEQLSLPLPSPLYLGLSLRKANLKAMHLNELKEYAIISAVTLLIALLAGAVVSALLTRQQRARDRIFAQLRIAGQVSHMVTWEMNHATGRFHGNGEFRKLFGFEEQTPTFAEYVKKLVAPNPTGYEKKYREAVRECRAVTHTLKLQPTPAGEERYFQERYDHLVDRNGKLVSTFGVLLDVTERHQQQAMVQNIINAQDSLIVMLDGQQIIFANQAFKTFFDLPENEDDNPLMTLSDLQVHFEVEGGNLNVSMTDDVGAWLQGLAQSYTETIVKMTSCAGGVHYFELAFHAISAKRGVLNFVEITDRYLAQQQLMTQANQDALTGAYNRHFYDSFLRPKLEGFLRENRVCGVLIFDIDFFKRINDTYGHAIGDEVLKTVVHLIKQNTRNNDYLIRWGGEEFILFVETEQLDVVMKVAENIRETVATHDFSSVGNVTISGGGTLLVPDERIETAIEAADQNLYQAKESGRNQIVVSAP